MMSILFPSQQPVAPEPGKGRMTTETLAKMDVTEDLI
jgi:hypothetical protein